MFDDFPPRQDAAPHPSEPLRPAPVAVTVEVVESYEGFRRLRPAWSALQERDPEMTVFLSWAWLDGAFRDNPGRWRIFVVRARGEGGRALAILPLAALGRWNAAEARLETVLTSAGRLIRSDYGGLLLDPEADGVVFAALARAIAARPWAELVLHAEVAPYRARRLLGAFPSDRFSMQETGGVAAQRPTIALPDSFETWLQTAAKPSLARRIRHFTRRQLDAGCWRVEVTKPATFERDASLVAGLEGAPADTRTVLANARKADALLLLVLWEGDRPLGALAHVLDHEMDRVHAIVGGALDLDTGSSVGILLHAEAIRWAIAHGFAAYDFGRGASGYRQAFGARDRTAPDLALRRADPAQAGFDRTCLGDGLRTVSALLHAGDVSGAQAAADQLAALVR
ncbi:GNAT family N-acetyltransferase [Roseivivax marinus]|uniref:GNAT family N-acetyltransferase n=1 Tax=Roseivivax marinus TaxID=1379903 RepID=UPI001F049986|nr:GNAT family N-acetyltransferase [Roseivivax marinus]UMA63770.1 GNAT family N-acetyltransferase [Roseivivax marinus]